MIYLNENNLKEIGIEWTAIINRIEDAVRCLANKDFAQPIKPYLRYGDPKNRIIAMPAYLGGNVNISGIKWIASFPDNIYNGIPRAHSVVVLNEAATGIPVAVINTALLSIIRTASVSGLMLKHYADARELKNIKLGIIGWGPIGQHHLKVCNELLGDKISKVFLYDMRPIIDTGSINCMDKAKIVRADSWQEAYEDADIFITCTASKEPYINSEPKKGSLLLNVSLRDYKTDIVDYVRQSIIVDDWEEVCRENTDIEMMYKEKQLMKEETKSIVDVVCNNCIRSYRGDQTIMFNPMGMGIFDMATAFYYYNKALEKGVGTRLD